MELHELLSGIQKEGLTGGILSNTRDHGFGEKIKIRPVKIREQIKYQAARYTKTQVFHENLSMEELVDKLPFWLESCFMQAEFNTKQWNYYVLISQKGKMTIKKKKNLLVETACEENYSHNREKQYILKDGEPVEFLVDLGVQENDGKIVKSRYDKFRQINRYLEFVEDVLDNLPKEGTIRIVDFGCGKSYLTFALYYYLKVLHSREIEVLGLDLKKDVIENCRKLADKCGYEHLHFTVGDISTFQDWDRADMVVSLHACDTATDYAIEKAVKWGARVILAVPCCQHEINKQIHCEALEPVLKYGVIKERISALLTDAIRAELLREQGYDTQILEFIDMEHTPKNILIRAVRRNHIKYNAGKNHEKLMQMEELLHVRPTLQTLLEKE